MRWTTDNSSSVSRSSKKLIMSGCFTVGMEPTYLDRGPRAPMYYYIFKKLCVLCVVVVVVEVKGFELTLKDKRRKQRGWGSYMVLYRAKLIIILSECHK